MVYRFLADIVVLLHVAFVLFVVLGGLLVLRWRRLAWVHLPAAIWGTLIELGGWICPLTPLENRLRALGEGETYDTGFVEHYLVPLLYPRDLTRTWQVALGLGVVLLNLALYACVIAQARRDRRRG
jgi:hypothetical protein